MQKTDIIIVNWNAGDQLRQCIASIRRYGLDHVGKCIVVDNGSRDGSTDFLQGAPDLDLVLTGRNLGFAAACNLGAARGTSPFILLLNPDAYLLEESLSHSLAVLQVPENARIGIVGVQLIGEEGSLQRTCARSPTPWRLMAKSFGITAIIKSTDFQMKNWDHSETRSVGQVMGAFFLVRRDLFKRLSGLDERFFVYFEEVDFSFRAKQLGFSSLYLADVQAHHKGGGVSEQVKAHRLFYSLRSRIQYAFKHFSWAAAGLVAFATLFVEPITRLSLLLLKRRFGEMGDLLRGYRMLWGWVLSSVSGAAGNAP